MQTQTQRPNRRPRLFLPLALMPRPAEAKGAKMKSPYLLSPDQLRRTVAEMID
jgi:hypothetical protein